MIGGSGRITFLRRFKRQSNQTKTLGIFFCFRLSLRGEMRPASVRWPQALRCAAAAILFRTAPSFQLKGSVILGDVSYHTEQSKPSRHPQATSLSFSLSCRGDLAPFRAASSFRNRPCCCLSAVTGEGKEGMASLSAVDTAVVEAEAAVSSKTEVLTVGLSLVCTNGRYILSVVYFRVAVQCMCDLRSRVSRALPHVYLPTRTISYSFSISK